MKKPMLRVREGLRESEERLRLALEAGRMGTWEWTIATNEVIWSPSLEADPRPRSDTLEGTFADDQKDIHPEDREHVLAAIAGTLEQGDDHHHEYRIVRPDAASAGSRLGASWSGTGPARRPG